MEDRKPFDDEGEPGQGPAEADPEPVETGGPVDEGGPDPEPVEDDAATDPDPGSVDERGEPEG